MRYILFEKKIHLHGPFACLITGIDVFKFVFFVPLFLWNSALIVGLYRNILNPK